MTEFQDYTTLSTQMFSIINQTPHTNTAFLADAFGLTHDELWERLLDTNCEPCPTVHVNDLDIVSFINVDTFHALKMESTNKQINDLIIFAFANHTLNLAKENSDSTKIATIYLPIGLSKLGKILSLLDEMFDGCNGRASANGKTLTIYSE